MEGEYTTEENGNKFVYKSEKFKMSSSSVKKYTLYKDSFN